MHKTGVRTRNIIASILANRYPTPVKNTFSSENELC
jgi:hypothetical protein